MKRKPASQTAVNIWPTWVEDDTLNLLNSNQLNQVTASLEQVKRQFKDDQSCPHVVVTGVTSNIDLEKVVHLNEVPSEIVESPSYVAAAQKPRSMVSEIPVSKRSQSPKRNRPVQSPEVKSARRASPDKNFLFSSKLLQAVLKSGSIIECKKGFDELEFHSFLGVR